MLIPQRYEFSSKSQRIAKVTTPYFVVADTTKVRIFKQITTQWCHACTDIWLLLIPQRYEFSSKSQPIYDNANVAYVVADTTKVRISKPLTTDKYAPTREVELLLIPQRYEFSSKSQRIINISFRPFRCCWYHKGTNFQANHNTFTYNNENLPVVADTTKVRIFKQITTTGNNSYIDFTLLLIPQRYEFSSKSQHGDTNIPNTTRCCWYHKGTNFQANHNATVTTFEPLRVVADTTKVRIFKQITTDGCRYNKYIPLLLIPQRYEFSSKSQPASADFRFTASCCWYHKGTNFQANHNSIKEMQKTRNVVADTTKVRIFKQITTRTYIRVSKSTLLLIPQRYEFSSKSQLLNQKTD